MNTEKQKERDIVLIDELRAGTSENSCVEFKHNNENSDMIGKLCSALANSACIQEKDFGYVVWGVEDDSHKVIGTNFDPKAKTQGGQVFELWLSSKLNKQLSFVFREVPHPEGRLVLLEIPATHTMPIEFSKTAYIRIGSATPKLTDYPQEYQKLIHNLRTYNWEKAIAKSFLTADEVIKLINYTSYFKKTNQNLPSNKKGILKHLCSDEIIKKDVGNRWSITNLGAILFAENLEDFDSSLKRKGIRFVAYDGEHRAATVKQRIDGKKGYANAFNGIVNYIINLLPVNETIGSSQRKEQILYPKIALRETIGNALIHQDMTITGTGPLVELFDNRLEITNPGKSLVQTDRMIDLPPRSRNEALASLMRRMKMCEEQGTGLDKVVISIELNQLPPPKFQEFDNSMRVQLFAPRSFAGMTVEERIRACYQHSIIKYLNGEKMKNSSLCERLGIDKKNAAQASAVIKLALEKALIKPADPNHPRSGYEPSWA
ncbi:ATP-binding protein [Tenacibaculum soleae]|uniref:ATP-binding protein n=1 Tax=Tenacibaculum soleae TaxID=447689 RepID=UPI00230016D2|nr:ATP-binding protein [Tenacibaculum soleae]